MQYPSFIDGSATSQSVIANGARTVNLYVEPVSGTAQQGKAALYPTPGFLGYVTVSDVGGRAAFAMGGRAFFILGSGFYELFSPASAIKRGTVAQDNNLGQIVFNGTVGGQLLIASGGNAYCYVLATNVLTQVLTQEVTQIGMIDGFFLSFNRALSKVRISALNDGTTWDPTQFALRSAQPDPWQALIINFPDIILLGEQLGDVWFDAGTAPFPLAPRQGLAIPYGIAAPFSLAVTGGNVIWLTANKDGAGLVVQMRGYNPQRISTAEVETAIAGYARMFSISDAEALVCQIEGHTFYVLRFPSASATWGYDLTTGKWIELGKWSPASDSYGVWAPRVHCYAFGQHLVADASGQVSLMNIAYGTEADGTAIRRLRRGPPIVQENRRLPMHRFELALEPGLGLQAGQGSNPLVMFRASGDGGKTWGNERTASAGPVGAYRRRVAFTRLGSPRVFVPEITLSDPIPWRIVDAFLNNDGEGA